MNSALKETHRRWGRGFLARQGLKATEILRTAAKTIVKRVRPGSGARQTLPSSLEVKEQKEHRGTLENLGKNQEENLIKKVRQLASAYLGLARREPVKGGSKAKGNCPPDPEICVLRPVSI